MDTDVVPYAIVLTGVAIVEAIQGFGLGNAHIIKDFLSLVLLIAMLFMGHVAASRAKQQRDHCFNYGYLRLNVMAAFVNTVYIMSRSIFNFLETIHQMIEQWEIDSHALKAWQDGKDNPEQDHSHALGVLESVHKQHEDPAHQTQTKLNLSIFALLKMVIIVVYLLQGNHVEKVIEYLYSNWFEMVKPLTTDYKKQDSFEGTKLSQR